jgi:hypothetical protein
MFTLKKYKTRISAFLLAFTVIAILVPMQVKAYGECSAQYGFGAYDDFSGSCRCMSGYVFGKDILGKTACVPADSVCRDQLGFSSRYDILTNSCECTYSYVIDNGRCVSGTTVCWNKHGYNSEYESYSESCKCSTSYTMDSGGQCVKKQNNVYFQLREVDTNTSEAVVRSEYDFGYYLIKYGIGCYSFSIKRYINSRIVINLGTDYNLDIWDKIVLQDNDEVCDITSVKRANSNTTLVPSEEDNAQGFYIPRPISPAIPYLPAVVISPPSTKTEKSAIGALLGEKDIFKKIPPQEEITINDVVNPQEVKVGTIPENGTIMPGAEQTPVPVAKISFISKVKSKIIEIGNKIKHWFKRLKKS